MAATAPTVLLTGATDGLGRALAERLVGDGARVVLHGRDPDRLARAASEIASTHGVDSPPTVQADLADLAQVAAMAARVREEHPQLDVLVNNAGVGSGEPDGRTRRTSADGHELRFAVNHLAGFLLTLELLDLLWAAAPARLVGVSSLGQYPLDFDDLMLEHGYSGSRAYAQSKLAQILVAVELAPRLSGSGVTVTTLHPGTYMPTKMVLQERGSSVDTLQSGVDATARLALDPALDGVTGVFFDRLREAEPNAQAADPEARRLLWERSVDLVRPFLSDAAAVP